MPIKGEQQGYTYKALINGEWQEVTIQESPLELVERFEQDEEWTRVRHGHWIERSKVFPDFPYDSTYNYECSNCGYMDTHGADVEVSYCWHCGARMDEENDL